VITADRSVLVWCQIAIASNPLRSSALASRATGVSGVDLMSRAARYDAHDDRRAAAVPVDGDGRLGQPARSNVIDYLREENRVLREQLGGRRLSFTDDQRRRFAKKGRAVSRRGLEFFYYRPAA
jgi:hypothetical protein